MSGWETNRLRSPTQLKELMRHTSIDTTLTYYVGANAEATAAVLWQTVSGGTSYSNSDIVTALSANE